MVKKVQFIYDVMRKAVKDIAVPIEEKVEFYDGAEVPFRVSLVT